MKRQKYSDIYENICLKPTELKQKYLQLYFRDKLYAIIILKLIKIRKAIDILFFIIKYKYENIA